MTTATPGRSLGIDVGSVTVKLALLDASGTVLHWSYEKHGGRPVEAIAAALRTMRAETGVSSVACAAVTGSARELVGGVTGLPTVNEIVAQTIAAADVRHDVATIIEIGGQDSKFIRLAQPAPGGRPEIVEQRMNDLCAAGTGAFVEQQAAWLDVSLDEFASLALASTTPAVVAGRCAVFAKSDIVHLRQEGTSRADIAAGICRAVARSYLAQFCGARPPQAPIVFQGGLAANPGVVRAFEDLLGVRPGALVVPRHFRVTGAIGAAHEARARAGAGERGSGAASVDRLLDALERFGSARGERDGAARRAALRSDGVVRRPHPAVAHAAGEPLALGVDVGSTSTCVAALSPGGGLVAKAYVWNRGDVVASVRAAIERIRERLGASADGCALHRVGVTGSGRHLVASCVDADLVCDEISAQARAAVHLLPDVDTVIEIGGQDAKFLRIADGRLVGFEMNRVCAAGTGSFLQEQAARLHHDVDALSGLALRAERPVNLGSRCTVFMESDLVHHQQTGCSTPDLVAGLSWSAVSNYLEKVVRGRPAGDRVLFLGGLAFNTSVAAAFHQSLGKEIVVPEHHEVSAAIGAALLALARERDARAPARLLSDLALPAETPETRSLVCGDCDNQCRLTEVSLAGEAFRHGGLCGKNDASLSKERPKPAANVARQRERLLLSTVRTAQEGRSGRVGVPRMHLFYDQFPLWSTFLQALGLEVVVSDATRGELVAEGLRLTLVDNCFSCKVAYGHAADLARKRVDWVFAPAVVEPERRVQDLGRNHSCPHVQALPASLQATVPGLRVRTPVFTRERGERDWVRELRALGEELGFERAVVDVALTRAAAAQRSFVADREALGPAALARLEPGQPAVVLLGKVYNACDPGLNLDLARAFARRGVLSIPYDCLPLSAERLPDNYADMVWAPGQDLMRAARWILRHPDVHPVLITNFGCGPDSFAIKYLDELFRDRPFLVIEVDEHTSAVGVGTRIEAFLSNLAPAAPRRPEVADAAFRPFVADPALRKLDRLVYVPLGFDSYRPIAAAFESIGIRTKVLPPHDAETLRLGRQHTAGNECLPYIMHVGDAVRMTRDPDFHPDRSALFLPASDLACRVSVFPTSMKLVLEKLGLRDFPIVAPRISMDKDEILKVFGLKFITNTFRGMLAVELLWRLQAELRPYEVVRGEVDHEYARGVDEICGALAAGSFYPTLERVLRRFDAIATVPRGGRPYIGLIGDDYTRGNAFANGELIRELERLGAEVWTVPIWSSYLEFQMGVKPGRTWRRGRWLEAASDKAKALLGRIDVARIQELFAGRLRCFPDPRFEDMLEHCARTGLDPRTDPQVIIAMSHLEHLMRRGAQGIVNVVGFQCMIHNIIAGRLQALRATSHAVPVLSLSFDFQERVHHRNRLEAFVYQVQQRRPDGAAPQLHPPSSAGGRRVAIL